MVSAQALPAMGGIETHVYEVSRRLARLDWDVTVLTTDRSGQLRERECYEGVEVKRVPARPRNRDYYFSPQMFRELVAGEFDLLHIQGIHTLIPPMALLAARRCRVPTVLSFHTGGSSSQLRSGVRDLQWRALAPLLSSADALIAVCEFEAKHFASLLGLPEGAIKLVRNGSEPLPVHLSDRPVLHGDPLLLSVGRLERYKGHHRMIAAMPHVLRRHPDARLVVVGSGPYGDALASQVEASGLQDSVSFASFAPDERAALGALEQSSDVVALLSDYEAHPIAVMEALALGRPVVVADTSGLSELAHQGLATAVPVDASSQDVAVALLAAVGHPPAGDCALTLQSWDDCAGQLHAVYEEVLSGVRGDWLENSSKGTGWPSRSDDRPNVRPAAGRTEVQGERR
jgi:glycosyltransferase involved in cell wall biosynthesis